MVAVVVRRPAFWSSVALPEALSSGAWACGPPKSCRRGRERSTSPFHDFRLPRGVTWLEPTLSVELSYSELMEGRLRDPVYRGLV